MDQEEQAYLRGQRTVWLSLLRSALAGLGSEGEEWTAEALLQEREEAIEVLRRLCAEHGDNDWESGLHLADIIDKHLARYFE